MKRLIVCCDGTWQDLDCPYPTNVVKITQAIKPKDSHQIPQLVYYTEGVGTGIYRIDRFVGGAFGYGIDQRIQEAYHFLCFNYEVGDEIYLFGFSRGAYTVRSLAGLIYNCGLLQRRHIRKAKEAYAIYRDRGKAPSSPEALQFRQQYTVSPSSEPGAQVPVTLLACWDTVGSLGVPNTVPLVSNWLNRDYKFHDTELNPTIQHALHAVAIDERRSTFDVTPMEHHRSREQQVNQVWFTGTHSCVGGGNEANRGLSDLTLKWMMEQIKTLGLGLEFTDNLAQDVENGIEIDFAIPFEQNLGIYGLLGTKDRQLLDPEDLQRQLDQAFVDALLHQSVKERWRLSTLNPRYRPKPLEQLKQWLDEVTHS